MRKIIIFGVALPGGGVESVINNLSLHINDSFQLKVVSLSKADLRASWPKGKVFHQVYPLIDSSNNLYFEVFKNIFKIYRIIRSEINDYNPNLTIVLSSHLLGFMSKKRGRLVFWPHHLLSKNRLYLAVIKHLTKDIDVWCVNRQILEQFHFTERRVLTYNPIDIVKSKMALNEPPNHISLLSVGFLNERKNFGHLIKLLSELELDWSLEIYGTGELLKPLEKQVVEFGLKEKIHFKGYKQIFHQRRLNYSAYITTSRSEGFSMALCDAGLRGIPLLLPDYLEVSKEFQSIGIATLFDIKDSVSLKKALSESAKEDPRRIREHIMESFGKKAFLSKVNL